MGTAATSGGAIPGVGDEEVCGPAVGDAALAKYVQDRVLHHLSRKYLLPGRGGRVGGGAFEATGYGCVSVVMN